MSDKTDTNKIQCEPAFRIDLDAERDESLTLEYAVTNVQNTPAKDSDTYNINHQCRGLAIIFNHKIFDDKSMETRHGTDKDAEDLNEVLSELGYEVVVHHNLKYGDIYETLYKVASSDHSDHSSLIVVVMSHGETGIIYAKDHTYKPETLWLPFTGDKCPSLAGKPKLFFIQACRGADVDDGVKIMSRSLQRDSGGAGGGYTIPVMADILVMYSTYDGYYSWRSPATGSWFIQSLCRELEDNWKNHDLLSILTFVNRRMAIGYESYVPNSGKMDRKKQIGTIVSTLTRRLFFV